MSFVANIPVVGRAEPPNPGRLPLLAEIFLMARSVEGEAEGLPWWFGRTRGSGDPGKAPSSPNFGGKISRAPPKAFHKVSLNNSTRNQPRRTI